MFKTKLIKSVNLLYHPHSQTRFAANFGYLNSFFNICHFLLNFVSFCESLKHICFSMLKILIIFFFNPSRLIFLVSWG